MFMAIRDAVKSWSIKQHLMVFGIGLALILVFASLTAFVALAYFQPGAFLAILALALFSYVVGTFFSTVLLGRDVDQ